MIRRPPGPPLFPSPTPFRPRRGALPRARRDVAMGALEVAASRQVPSHYVRDEVHCSSFSTAAFASSGVTPRKAKAAVERSEEHTSELQSQSNLVCRLLLEKK